MIDNTYISEAFKELSLLQEEVFKLDDDGIDEMQDFVDNDEEEDILDVIDTKAETEEELEDNYIGKVILDCSVCHSKLYKDVSEIVTTEDSDLVNVGDECPYCTSVDGYTIIGQVAPYKPEDEITVTVEPKEEEESDWIKTDDEEEIDESLKFVDNRKNSIIRGDDDPGFDEYDEEDFQDDSNKFDTQKIENPEEDDLHSTKPVVECDKIKESKENLTREDNKFDFDSYRGESEEIVESQFDDMEPDVDFEEKPNKDDIYRNAYISSDSDHGTSSDDILTGNKAGEFVDYGDPEDEIEEKPADVKSDKVKNKNSIYDSNDVIKNPKYPKNPLTPERLKEIGLFTAISDSLIPNAERTSALRHRNNPEDSQVYYTIHVADTNFDIDDNYNILVKAFSDEEIDALDKVAEYLGVKLDYIPEKSYTHVKFNIPADSLMGTGVKRGRKVSGKNKPETANEGLESLSLETETDRIYISAEEKETVDGEEMIAPLDAETKAALDSNVDLTAEPVEDEEEFDMEDMDNEVEESSDEEDDSVEEEPEEIDVDMDEFSEEDFDDVAESYFKRNYSNVESFNTSAVKSDNSHMIIEGIIKFTSGNQKKTTFIFESKDITRDGKMKFVGENAQISRGKKSFAITGRLNEKGSFITESLNYNYRAKDMNGKSNRVYGTVKNKR